MKIKHDNVDSAIHCMLAMHLSLDVLCMLSSADMVAMNA